MDSEVEGKVKGGKWRESKGRERKSSTLVLIDKFYGGKGNKGFLINLVWLTKGKERKGYIII